MVAKNDNYSSSAQGALVDATEDNPSGKRKVFVVGHHNLWTLNARLNGASGNAIMDTGGTVSVVS